MRRFRRVCLTLLKVSSYNQLLVATGRNATVRAWEKPMADEQPQGQEPDINDQQLERQRALEEIANLGVETYPHKFARTHTITEIVRDFSGKSGEELEAAPVRVQVAGRVHAINKMGKAAFIRFTDGGELMQIYLRSNEVDEKTWALFKLLDLGDFVGTE